MRIVDWRVMDEAARSDVLARPRIERDGDLVDGVRRIVADVRAHGDSALADLTERLDGCRLDRFSVSEAEFMDAEARVDDSVRAAMSSAIARVGDFHRAQLPRRLRVQTAPGVICELLVRPIHRVGLYAPAGSAPLPSTVWMLAVPALLAGCREIVLATPPDASGRADPMILVAARLCGIERVIKLGGAQAIAAMAYGTQTIPKCDKVFGPGNAWVMQAKLEVAGDPEGCAIDLPAGPSEVMVIADGDADPVFVAADLLAQAEHGPDSQVVLLTPSDTLIEAVVTECRDQLAGLPRAVTASSALAHARLIRVQDLSQAVAIAERYAPEHLIIQAREPRALLPGITTAGSVFLGPWSPETVGDYCAGPNHVLPTSGFARAYSGVGVASFQRRMSVQALDAEGLRRIGPEAALLARAECLEGHARAVDLRLARIDELRRTGADTGAAA
jgi:histidinol dehydrogenase